MKATVLLPVYNSDSFIREAVDSILQQTFRDFELLIFDDGSTDNTREILKSFHDPRIQLHLSDQNRGYLYHLNRGIDLARGEYILRMDADDIALPQRFEKQIGFMDAHPEVGLCGTWADYLGSSSRGARPPTDHEQIVVRLLGYTTVIHPAAIIRTSVLRRSGLKYDPAFYTVEDHELWVRLSACTRLANIPEVLLLLRRHTKNISVLHREKQKTLKKRIRKTHFQQLLRRPLNVTEQDLVTTDLDFSQPLNFKKIRRFFQEVQQANQSRGFDNSDYLKVFLLKMLLKNLRNGGYHSPYYWWNRLLMIFWLPPTFSILMKKLKKRGESRLSPFQERLFG